MQKRVHIFKSLQEQELYHLKMMQESSVAERFRQLYLMQQMTRLLHPVKETPRKIQIRKWIS